MPLQPTIAEVRFETPLDALKAALVKAGIAFDSNRLDGDRDYYESMQLALVPHSLVKPPDDPIDKALLELQISQRVLEALRPVKPEKRLAVLRAASLLLLGKDIGE